MNYEIIEEGSPEKAAEVAAEFIAKVKIVHAVSQWSCIDMQPAGWSVPWMRYYVTVWYE